MGGGRKHSTLLEPPFPRSHLNIWLVKKRNPPFFLTPDLALPGHTYRPLSLSVCVSTLTAGDRYVSHNCTDVPTGSSTKWPCCLASHSLAEPPPRVRMADTSSSHADLWPLLPLRLLLATAVHHPYSGRYRGYALAPYRQLPAVATVALPPRLSPAATVAFCAAAVDSCCCGRLFAAPACSRCRRPLSTAAATDCLCSH